MANLTEAEIKFEKACATIADSELAERVIALFEDAADEALALNTAPDSDES